MCVSSAMPEYAPLHCDEADRLVTLTEAADVCQREVRRLRAEAIEASTALRLATGRLTRAWEAVDRLSEELTEAAKRKA